MTDVTRLFAVDCKDDDEKKDRASRVDNNNVDIIVDAQEDDDFVR